MLAQAARKITEANMAAFLLLGPSNRFYLQAADGFTDHDLIIMQQSPPSPPSLCHKALQHNGPLIWRECDGSLEGHIHDQFELKPIEELALQIRHHGVGIGVLYLGSTIPGVLYKITEDSATSQALNELVACAATICMLFTWVLDDLDVWIAQFDTETDKSMAKVVAKWVENNLHPKSVMVFMLGTAHGNARCLAALPSTIEEKLTKADILLSDDQRNTFLKNVICGNPIIINDTTDYALEKQVPPIQHTPILSEGNHWCGIPITAGDEDAILGALVVCEPWCHLNQDSHVGAEDAQLLTSVAKKLGQYWNILRRDRLSKILDECSSQLIKESAPKSVATILLKHSLRAFPAIQGFVFMRTEDGQILVANSKHDSAEPIVSLEWEETLPCYIGPVKHISGIPTTYTRTELYSSVGKGTVSSPGLTLLLLSPIENAYSSRDAWAVRNLLMLSLNTLRYLFKEASIRQKDDEIQQLDAKLREDTRIHTNSIRALGNVHHFRAYANRASKLLQQLSPIREFVRSARVASHYNEIYNELHRKLRQIEDLANDVAIRIPEPKLEYADLHKILLEMTKNTVFRNSDDRIVYPQIVSNQLLPQVEVDRSSIAQAISNMVKNSAEADARFIKIHLSVTEDEQSKRILRIAVSDDGKGIRSNIWQDIFTLGFTYEKSEVDGRGGSGIGLADCKDIIERIHNGRIYLVRSTPFKDTTFNIDLPL